MPRFRVAIFTILIACGVQGCDQRQEPLSPKHDKSPNSDETPNEGTDRNSGGLSSATCGPSFSDSVELAVEVVGAELGRPAVKGKTNLPQETRLAVRVSSEDGFSDAAEISVGTCRYAAGPFSNRGKALDDGDYSVTVSLSPMDTQPATVKKIIKTKHTTVDGSPQEDSPLGQGPLATKDFEVTRQAMRQERLQAQQAHASEAWEIHDAIAVLLHDGRSMARLRNTDDPSKLGQCASKMKRYQPRAEALRERAEELPRSSYGTYLTLASARLNRCVSCLRDSYEACDDVAEELDGARRTMPDKPNE